MTVDSGMAPREGTCYGDPKPPARVRANSAAWKKLHADCWGPCLICGDTWRVELHHLVPRAQGGDDIKANLVPLCAEHHRRVTEHVGLTCVDLRQSLSPEHIRYCVDKVGAERFEKSYPWSGS